MMKRILTWTMAMACCSLLNAQTEVAQYRPGVTENGITYFLPRTCLHITVTAERTVYVPGEFCGYANRFLRLKNVPQNRYEEWEIKGITVTPYGSADKKQAYTIKLKPKTSAPLVSLSADGRLLAINAAASEPAELSQPSVKKTKAETTNPANFKTEAILAAGSTSKMAELTANEIYDIRENRSLLTKGQADFMPKDGEQLRLMLKELDEQEQALLSLFSGTSSSETHVFTLDYVPAGEVEHHVLFRFSKHLGMVDADDLAGAPFYIDIKDLHTLPAVADLPAKPKKEIEDVRYVVPGRAAVSINGSAGEVYAAQIPMSQFGRIEHLGGDLFNKKFTTKVFLSPETGGILKIEGEEP